MANNKSSNQEIRQIVDLFNNNGFEEMAAKVEARLKNGQKLTSAMEKTLQKAMIIASKELREKLKLVKQMETQIGKLNDRQKEHLKITKDEAKELEKQLTVYDRLLDAQEDNEKQSKNNEKSQGALGKAFEKTTDRIRENISVVGLLNNSLSVLEKLYNNWFRLQETWTQGMGNMARTTGATTRQLQEMRTAAEDMRTTFAGLRGPIDGIGVSLEFISEVSMGMRRSAGQFSREFLMEMEAAADGLGLGVEGAAQLQRALEAGLAGGNEDLGDFVLNIREFSESIGANASQMSREFLEARDSLALFGEDAERVFRETATVANRLGFETSRLLDMARRFDMFSSASENVNQLNAMFGTTISSMELLQATDPVERISLITDSIRSQGLEWRNMDRYQQQALAQSLGVSESEAARLMNGEDMSSILADQQAAAERQAVLAEREGRARETILEVIEGTRTVFRGIQDYIQAIINDISEVMAPIFEAIHQSTEKTAVSFREWIRRIATNPDFRNTIQQIANWIRELPRRIEEFLPTWEQMRKTALDMWPTIQRIGEVLMDVINFAVEHPEAIAVALGAIAALQLASGLSGALTAITALTGAAPGLISAFAPLAVALSPLLALAGSAAVAGATDSNRTGEGGRVRQRDVGTMAHLQETARGQFAQRRVAASMGNSQGAITGFGDSGGLNLSEALGTMTGGRFGMSGQEADQHRNDIESVIRDFIRPGNLTPAMAANQIQEMLGGDLANQVAQNAGAPSFGEYINRLYMEDAALREMYPSALGLTSPQMEQPQSAVDTAPITATTATAAPLSNGSSGGTPNLTTHVYIGGREVAAVVARTHVEGAII